MQRKEYYKHNLPHFQQPGQAYFVTWSLKCIVPKHKFRRISSKLNIYRSQLRPGFPNSDSRFSNRGLETAKPSKEDKLFKKFKLLQQEYVRTYNRLLDEKKNPSVDLSKPGNISIISNALHFWEGVKLKNYAFCIMPNHVHWVFEVLEKDKEGNPVYLQDIMYSVKRFTANKINKSENRSGSLWQKESFDTTIRDHQHLYHVIEYTLNNPVNAGFVDDRTKWKGSWCAL